MKCLQCAKASDANLNKLIMQWTWYKHSSIIHLENSISKPTKNKRKHLVPILDTSHSTIVYQKPGGKAQLYNSYNLGRVLIDGLQGVPEIGIIVQNDEKANSPIEQNISPTVDSQSASITSISSLGNSLENRLAKRKRFPKAPEQRKNNTLLSSLKNILCKKDDNSSTVLTEINNNLCHLVEIEQKKYKLKCLKLQLKYPDIEFCEIDQ
ncbi:hypothetical protein RN001_008703 [Aquatica leii]|uniref:Uncharacterized protein n=1 Tax=Aquatica leii TaxID=1421715 RepID=A0AAN7P9Z0_9COLE|nr:hypothetical protein RN001_008703 [Aquatica leii]